MYRPLPVPLFTGLLAGMLMLTSACTSPGTLSDSGPPAEPAHLDYRDGELTLTYDGAVIFTGQVSSDASVTVSEVVSGDEAVMQAIRVQSADLRTPVALTGEIIAGLQAFACEVDRRRTGLDIVRHSSGPSRSTLNRAVYDRLSDWALSIDIPTVVTITPGDSARERNRFIIEAEGTYITLRFRPRWYGRHRGLTDFRPWEYDVWPGSVAGWCSWFAWFRDIDEEKLHRAAEVFSRELLPWGYTYFQVDDGYQQDPGGPPESWLVPNDKFPSGLADLAGTIRSKGLVPGIWTYASFHDPDWVEAHPEMFVRTPAGEPARGMWVGYVMDASVPATRDEIIRPIYRGLKEMGWGYFKVDALRHLRYEGYNSHPGYFSARGLDRVEVFRDYARTVRSEIGEESFMLGCWGIRPELIGIIDGCRIGGDGFSYAGLAQYNSFNNVIWRNDPDHVELTPEEAWRSCMVTSLTGSVLMLTDRPERYESALVEPARRAAPVLFTLPGQVYDVDPSRSMHLDAVDTEVSGDGHRIFDANLTPRCELFLLEITRDFGSWVVLGRMGETTKVIPLAELGLPAGETFHVTEFWSGRYRGAHTVEFAPGPIDPQYGCQLFVFRPDTGRPQLLATSRHVSAGGLELDRLNWQGNVLVGRSELVGGDPCTLTLFEPAGWNLDAVECRGARVIANSRGRGSESRVRWIVLERGESGAADWTVRYRRSGG